MFGSSIEAQIYPPAQSGFGGRSALMVLGSYLGWIFDLGMLRSDVTKKPFFGFP